MDIQEEIAEQASGVLAEAYRDLVQPSAKPVGTVASLLPRTVRLWFGKWERWVTNGEESLEKTAEAIRDKIRNTPEERLCEPESYIALPAIQQISYCYDSAELRDMYANLLATSMDSAVKDEVHPSYVELIKQLSPDEAKLLAVLSHDALIGSPVIDLQVDFGHDGGFRTVLRNFSLVGSDVCQHPDRIPSYLENLCRLKLIEISEAFRIKNEESYNPLIDSSMVQELKASTSLPDDASFGIVKKVLYITNFGRGFIKCCVDNYGSR